MSEDDLDATLVRWYEPLEQSADIVQRWLSAAGRHLPEAVPVRFDDSEPLRRRFDTEAGLTNAYLHTDGLLFLQCTRPVSYAALAAPRVPKSWGRYGAHVMHTSLRPSDERLQRFALSVVGPGTVYVSASVAGANDPGAEPHLAPLGRWHGPPVRPPAWFWLCPRYERRLRDGWLPEKFCARLDEVEPSRRRAARFPWGLR